MEAVVIFGPFEKMKELSEVVKSFVDKHKYKHNIVICSAVDFVLNVDKNKCSTPQECFYVRTCPRTDYEISVRDLRLFGTLELSKESFQQLDDLFEFFVFGREKTRMTILVDDSLLCLKLNNK